LFKVLIVSFINLTLSSILLISSKHLQLSLFWEFYLSFISFK
jgi:hypothetical protein